MLGMLINKEVTPLAYGSVGKIGEKNLIFNQLRCFMIYMQSVLI
jgi:hypothetical protein